MRLSTVKSVATAREAPRALGKAVRREAKEVRRQHAWPDDLVRLYQAEYPKFVRLAYLLTGSSTVAEELVQDAFIRCEATWHKVEDSRAYVRRSVVNATRSWLRRAALERRQVVSAPEAEYMVVDELWDALGKLKPSHRAAVVLRYYQGLSDDAIAEALSCRPATVRTWIHRGLATLRREVQP